MNTKAKKIIIITASIIVVAAFIGFVYDFSIGIADKNDYPRKYSEYVEAASDEFGVPEYIIYSVIKVESNFDPDSESDKGAVGLMQLLPGTFSWLTNDMVGEMLPASYIYDNATNIRYGTYYLSYLYKRYGVWNTVFAAYNGGQGNVDNWLRNPAYSLDGKNLITSSIPFGQTRHYVIRVNEAIEEYKKLYKY